VTLKTIMAAAITAALIAGLCLPAVLRQAEPKSQIEQIEVGPG
jgi:hypothetical protein